MEHRQLRRHPYQIEVVERPGERPYLKYTEDVSKNHPGGLKGRKSAQKVVFHHSNTDNLTRCFVRLFKMYLAKCPNDAPSNAFYLRPASTVTAQQWYTRCPLGHNSLSKTVSRLCKLASIQGIKTNHSLRATATSRLYQSGIDEQLVMERTGQRSLEGVRTYKRTSNTQREALSDILNLSKRPQQIGTGLTVQPDSIHSVPPSQQLHEQNAEYRQQLVTGLSLPSATFANCTVNFYMSTGSGPSQSPPPTIGQKRKRRIIIESDSDIE